MQFLWETEGTHSGVDEDSILVGYNAFSAGKYP
jgi:hypothetical protein